MFLNYISLWVLDESTKNCLPLYISFGCEIVFHSTTPALPQEVGIWISCILNLQIILVLWVIVSDQGFLFLKFPPLYQPWCHLKKVASVTTKSYLIIPNTFPDVHQVTFSQELTAGECNQPLPEEESRLFILFNQTSGLFSHQKSSSSYLHCQHFC